MNLGKAIKVVRIEADMHQEELASEIGCDKSHLSLLEMNKRNPSIPMLCKIAARCWVTPSELLKKAEDYEKITNT